MAVAESAEERKLWRALVREVEGQPYHAVGRAAMTRQNPDLLTVAERQPPDNSDRQSSIFPNSKLLR